MMMIVAPWVVLDVCVFWFFVSRATGKPFKIFCLYSQGNLTFTENPIIGIAAKFQYKIPSLRALAVMDTISWSSGHPHRKSCTFLQRSWTLSSAPIWENVLKTVQWNVNIIYYFDCCCCCQWWCLLLGLLPVLRPSISSLLQSATTVTTRCDSSFYYKVYWSVITKCDSFFYYKERQVLLQRLYKVWQFHYKVW